MRGDVQTIFQSTPHKKQVLFFSATMPKEVRELAKKFMNKVWFSFNFSYSTSTYSFIL